VKRGNLYPEQHQIGMHATSVATAARRQHAGRWLERAGNCAPERNDCPSAKAQDKTRLIGELALIFLTQYLRRKLSHFQEKFSKKFLKLRLWFG
jgi:hypothetical protein